MVFSAIENIKFIKHKTWKGYNNNDLVQSVLHSVINIAFAIILQKINSCDIDIADICLAIFTIYCNIA